MHLTDEQIHAGEDWLANEREGQCMGCTNDLHADPHTERQWSGYCSQCMSSMEDSTPCACSICQPTTRVR